MRTLRFPVRTIAVRLDARLSPPSSATKARKRSVDLLDDLEVARQQPLQQVGGHFSSASGSTVCWCSEDPLRPDQASSQPSAFVVHQHRISSGDRQHRVGVVQLDRHLRGRSCRRWWLELRKSADVLSSVADTKKYCCLSRSSCPRTGRRR